MKRTPQGEKKREGMTNITIPKRPPAVHVAFATIPIRKADLRRLDNLVRKTRRSRAEIIAFLLDHAR